MAGKLGGFLRGLVGSGGAPAETATSGEAVDYKGYEIRPACRKDGNQWLTAGVITKSFDDGEKAHHFIRADMHASQEVANDCAIGKAKRIVDEQGDGMFTDSSWKRP